MKALSIHELLCVASAVQTIDRKGDGAIAGPRVQLCGVVGVQRQFKLPFDLRLIVMCFREEKVIVRPCECGSGVNGRGFRQYPVQL